jgi:uncharacterized protein
MNKLFFLGLLLGATYTMAQIPAPINSGEIWQKASELKNEDKPEEALTELLKVDRNDTNYAAVLADRSGILLELEKFDEVIKACDEGLQLKSESEFSFYVNKGLAYLRKESVEDALKVFDQALQKYPKSYLLYYNKGAAYKQLKKYPESIEMYKKCIEINPYYSPGHLALGLLASEEGNITQAVLSLNMFLIINPNDSKALPVLKRLNEIVSSKYERTPLGATLSPEGGDDFSESDLIITNYAALGKGYKIPVKTELAIVKQNHALLTQLKNNPSDKGFWNKKYVPFFADLYKKGLFEGFTYYILQASQNVDHIKLVKKNQAAITQFITWAYPEIGNLAANTIPDASGKPVKAKSFFDSQTNALEAVGNLTGEGKPSGYFEYYYPNGNLGLKGNFNNLGKKEGLWSRYHTNGTLSEVSEYKNGELNGPYKLFHDNGMLFKEGFYENDKLKGENKIYNYGGLLVDLSTYSNDLAEGKFTTYFDMGEKFLQYKGRAVNGKIEDTLYEYYVSGEPASKKVFSAGELNGEFRTFYRNGKTMSVSNFVNGKKDGAHKEYFNTGKISQEGLYKNDIEIGLWKSFYKNGKPESETQYDEKGKRNGTYKAYDTDGKIHYEYAFVKGEINSYKFYDKKGGIIKEGKKTKGDLAVTTFNPEGVKESEGAYSGENRKGLWKYYNKYGQLEKEINYNASGEIDGVWKLYYPTGKLRQQNNYKNGKLEGYSAGYYRNGQKEFEGWYTNDELNGYYATYYRDGTPESRQYYLRDKKEGLQQDFTVTGKLKEDEYCVNHRIEKIITYDTTGKITDSIILPNGTGKITRYYYNKKESFSGNYIFGIANGEFVSKSADGKTDWKGKYLNNKREGNWIWYADNGKTETEGTYNAGMQTGKWNYYYPTGKLMKTFNYEFDNHEGEGIWYHENGQIDVKKNYENDEETGEAFYYADNGDLMMVRNYVNGKTVSYTYPDNTGKLKTPIEVSPTGTYKVVAYYKNGNKARELEFVNGLSQGKFLEYYPSGKIKESANYKDDVLEGVRTEYYADGKLKSEEPFSDGEYNGTAKYYFPDGKPEKEINYRYGIYHGKAVYYQPGGKILKTEIYNSGILTKISNN